MIAIVNYGLGNIAAFSNMFKRLNIEARVAQSATELTGASKIILPGVGAFDHAMQQLQASGMRSTLDTLVLEQHVPVLGICVGMQMLAHGSDEGELPGLGWVSGRVRAFHGSPEAQKLPLPHMGWNDVQPREGEPLFDQLQTDARFYFLHSFYFECDHAEHAIATAHYGLSFGCAVRAGHVHGVQFHPEKSHHWGSRLLQNFANL